MDFITDVDAVHLLINTYMIKQLESKEKPLNQEKFIGHVQEVFSENNLIYNKKHILTTWKRLLEKYYHLKEKFTAEYSKSVWKYFGVMDNCFDETRSTVDKFSDSNVSLFLIKCMMDHKDTLIRQGLTMNILIKVEKKFKNLQNNDINQKDIYIQWNSLKKYYDNVTKKTVQPLPREFAIFLKPMKLLFEIDGPKVSQSGSKRALMENADVSMKKCSKKHALGSLVVLQDMSSTSTMQDIASQFTENEKNTSEDLVGTSDYIQNYNSNTRQWQYEFIKNDKTNKFFLNRYETNYKELAEVKELLLENNLLRKETKYLLNLFSEKLETKIGNRINNI